MLIYIFGNFLEYDKKSYIIINKTINNILLETENIIYFF